jgi:hypothetical protein
MTNDQPANLSEAAAFEAMRLELAELVGRDIKVFSEQMPGKELRSKVLATQDQQLQIFSGGPGNLIDSLVNNQSVIIQCRYRGEELSIRAKFRKAGGGRCHLALEEKVTPLRQRRFRRINFVRPVRLAAFPMNLHARTGIGHLRWLQTDTINFSSGGIMVALPTLLDQRACLIMSLDLQDLAFPSLILAQVCHAHQIDIGPFRTGVEFVTREQGASMVPETRRRDLPGAVFEFSAAERERLNREILKWPGEMEFI